MGDNTAALDINFSKRFSTNLISNIIYFILNLIIGLALAPFFLDTLGPSAYGLIPLATSVSSYVTLLISSINSSVSRFLTIDLQKGDIDAANKTFNTALFGTLAIVLILLPISLLIAFLAPTFFSIGDVAATDVIWLFALVFISVLIRTWSSTFMVPLFAHNRLDLRNYVEISNLVVQVGLIVLFFAVFGPSLVLVGAAYVIAAVFSRILAGIYARKVSPYLKIQISKFVWGRFKEIGDVALWMGFNMIGGLLYGQIGLMVVNIFFGDIAGTQYSLCLTWWTLIVSISGLVTNLFTPKIYSHYSRNDRDGLLKFTKFTIKITGLFMALPIGLVYIFVPQLMTIWVGAEYAHLGPLVWILLLPIMTKVQASCIAPINAAYKRVRFPAVANFIAGAINLTLALSLPFIFDIGMYGVAAAYAISMFFLTGIASPFYNAYVMQAPKFTYFKYMVLCTGVIGIIFAAGMLYTSFVTVDSILMLILSGLLISVVYGLIILLLVLKKEERQWIRECIPTGVGKFIPKWLL